jgi:hypothetical protein
VSHWYKIPFGQSHKNSVLFIERSEITFVPLICIIIIEFVFGVLFCFLF